MRSPGLCRVLLNVHHKQLNDPLPYTIIYTTSDLKAVQLDNIVYHTHCAIVDCTHGKNKNISGRQSHFVACMHVGHLLHLQGLLNNISPGIRNPTAEPSVSHHSSYNTIYVVQERSSRPNFKIFNGLGGGGWVGGGRGAGLLPLQRIQGKLNFFVAKNRPKPLFRGSC